MTCVAGFTIMNDWSRLLPISNSAEMADRALGRARARILLPRSDRAIDPFDDLRDCYRDQPGFIWK